MSAERVSGAELLRRALVHAGVRVMFGHPGGAILPFYDVLHGAEEVTMAQRYWSGMSRVPRTPPTATRERPAKSGCAWPPAVRALPTW